MIDKGCSNLQIIDAPIFLVSSLPFSCNSISIAPHTCQTFWFEISYSRCLMLIIIEWSRWDAGPQVESDLMCTDALNDRCTKDVMVSPDDGDRLRALILGLAVFCIMLFEARCWTIFRAADLQQKHFSASWSRVWSWQMISEKILLSTTIPNVYEGLPGHEYHHLQSGIPWARPLQVLSQRSVI